MCEPSPACADGIILSCRPWNVNERARQGKRKKREGKKQKTERMIDWDKVLIDASVDITHSNDGVETCISDNHQTDIFNFHDFILRVVSKLSKFVILNQESIFHNTFFILSSDANNVVVAIVLSEFFIKDSICLLFSDKYHH